MKTVQQTIKYRIIRRTSPYNKYIKWFTECYHDDGSLLSSAGYRTEREARAEVSRSSTLPVGNRMLETTYIEIDEPLKC